MAAFGKKTLRILAELDPELQVVLNTAIEIVDFSLVCGFRGQLEQNAAFDSGRSKVKFPDSKHNRKPSDAVDFMPFPDTGKNVDYIFVAGMIIAVARILKARGIIKSSFRYGNDWNRNDKISDETFPDAGHIEKDGEK